MLEKIERDRKKREEKEKLKFLEKLESQVLKKKKKLNQLPNSSAINSANTTKEPMHKRLIDNIKKSQNDNFSKIDNKLLDDSEFRKTIRKEKIEILCDKSENIENDSKSRIFYNTQQNEVRMNKDQVDRIDQLNTPKIKNKIVNHADDENLLEKEFLSSLSKEKKKFFMLKLSEVYEFLKSIKLVRYIETFIEDGIEDLECVLGKIKNNNYFNRNRLTLF